MSTHTNSFLEYHVLTLHEYKHINIYRYMYVYVDQKCISHYIDNYKDFISDENSCNLVIVTQYFFLFSEMER